MTTVQICKMYGGEVEVAFYPDSHRYKKVGDKGWLTSVTAITGIIDKSRVLIGWALNLAEAHINGYLTTFDGEAISKDAVFSLVKEAVKQHQVVKDTAASNGSLVHAWAESYARAKIHGEPMPKIADDLPDQVIAGINAFLDWVNCHNVKFLETERMIYSKIHGYVGLVDAMVEIDGKKILVDYKTSKDVYNEMRYQVAAYRLAYEEEMGAIDGHAIVHFSKETGDFSVVTIKPEDYPKDAATFLACLTVKQREKELSKE